MARRRGVSRNFQRSPRRLTNWTFGFLTGGVQAVAVNAALASAILDPEVAEVTNGTLIRVRGVIRAQITSAAGVDGLIGFGIAVVEQRAFTAGIAANALPRPISEGGDDIWLWHGVMPLWGDNAPSDAIAGNATFEVDSKAMRKFEDNVTVALIAESDTVAFEYGYGLRVLSKAGM